MNKKITYIALALLLHGCGVLRYSAGTKATAKITTPDGVLYEFSYDSEKEQKLIVELVKQDDKITVLKVGVEAGTSEAAIMAATQMGDRLSKILEQWAPLIAKGAMAGS